MDTVSTSTPPLSPGAQAVLAYVRAEDWVTYAATEEELAPHIVVEGDGGIAMGGFVNLNVRTNRHNTAAS
jgi:hypothetical protein